MSLWTNPHPSSLSYKHIIKQLASQAPKVYGDIPPRKNVKVHKKRAIHPETDVHNRMSHVENWVLVDKERLPDEQDLTRSLHLRNYLTFDFVSEVLPLHTPPLSLSDPRSEDLEDQMVALADKLQVTRLVGKSLPQPVPFPASVPNNPNHKKAPLLVRRTSFTSQTPSIRLTLDSSSNQKTDQQTSPLLQQVRWLQTMQRLRHSLIRFGKKEKPHRRIPFPAPPPKPRANRRSEATTQPRFNPVTNTYLRDTRANPDHLRMIVAELNMIRHRKLMCPLRRRDFLPRRNDIVYLGSQRRRSPLMNEALLLS
ncbi:hypothetical protein DM01DRAFT_1381585 [Hesseltinella vesiculosa]|uniref:Uncharacterized protein n=1 Tax=Hesseltinella vesiculosa TaxID=101127 RepID=A0A1X2GQE7_9FUNG|nr:hypothetical protein DM01DRAFT_1381585 [Hesseltinella vesiculosa]